MSTQSSCHRNSRIDLYSAVINPEMINKSASNNLCLSPKVTMGYNTPLHTRNNLHKLSKEPIRTTRPVSEIIKPSTVSPETEALDKWYEDLQHYESSLESMASASLDPTYKEEVQHVDQWYQYLNEAERTATIYTLLQHSTQVQIRFFITVLQQLGKKDPLAALLAPAQTEKDIQNSMIKAEIDASHKFLSVLPNSERTSHGRRNLIDRHSFALGDTEEYDRLFSNRRADNYPMRPLSANYSQEQLLPQSPQLQSKRTGFDRTVSPRPKSVIEGDIASIFNQEWPYTPIPPPSAHYRPKPMNRPKSADITHWSFSLNPDNDESLSPWTNLDPPEDTRHKWNLPNTSLLNIHLKEDSYYRSIHTADKPEEDKPFSTPTILTTDSDSYPYLTPIPSHTHTLPTLNKPHYGHYLNPNDRLHEEYGYGSDHSDTSNTFKHHKKPHPNRMGKDKKSQDTVDMAILEDIPAWLRSLRLHKYTPNFTAIKWQDMILLDDQALSDKGVAALGARRKLLKVFEQVKCHCEKYNITY